MISARIPHTLPEGHEDYNVPTLLKGVSENRGTLCWGSYNKDPTISNTILGSPIFGNCLMASTKVL